MGVTWCWCASRRMVTASSPSSPAIVSALWTSASGSSRRGPPVVFVIADTFSVYYVHSLVYLVRVHSRCTSYTSEVGNATKPLGHPHGVGASAVHRGARRDDRECRAPQHPGRPALLRSRSAVGDQCLHAAVRRFPAPRRPGRRRARPATGLRRGTPPLRRHV